MKSDDVKVLIVEAEAASIASGETVEQARQRAFDPALTANAVAQARREMEDAVFWRERLRTAVTRLQDWLKEVRAQEEDHRRWIAYEKAKAERDKLGRRIEGNLPIVRSATPRPIAWDRRERPADRVHQRTSADRRRSSSRRGVDRT